MELLPYQMDGIAFAAGTGRAVLADDMGLGKTIQGIGLAEFLIQEASTLENRLGDLFSVVDFIDDRRLGPAFRFFHRHRVTDERGKVLGYKDLDVLRENLKPVLLRRTRSTVMKDLPPRTTEIVRIPPTDEQLQIELAQMQIVSTIVRKKYISEMDLLRLQKALLLARMNADSTYLMDKQEPGYSTKLERLAELLGELSWEEERKIVLFSEWTTMLGLFEPILERLGLSYVRLDGSVPQKKRQKLVQQFQQDPACKVFITTNAGSTGLNLQAANTVINVDLPWNPSVLDQRIGRAHRMGQKRPVQVYVLVTEETIEEKLLATLSSKHQLALAALDMESDLDKVALVSGMEELKRRLEVLLGARPEAPVDESDKHRREEESERLKRQSRVAEAGGQLLSAALNFLGELIPQREATGGMAQQFREHLDQCVDRGEDGRPRLTVTFPDEAALDNLARTLATILAGSAAETIHAGSNGH